MSKRKAETTAVLLPVPRSVETTSLSDINPSAERARQLRIIELLEEISAKLGQTKTPENK